MKEPLFPHVTKRKEPLYPHRAKSQTCKAEIGIPGIRYLTKPCPEPAIPGEDYCPLHLALVKRLEERSQRGLGTAKATLEVPKELETLAQEARKYKSAEEWVKFDKGKEISKVLIGGQGLLPSGTDINYLSQLEALRKWGGDKSDIEIVSAFYNQVTKGEVTEVTPEVTEIDQIIAGLNLLREERVWIDTFKTTGASVIHIQTGDTATITSPPEDFTSPNYADRAMQIKWADGSEMVVDSNDFAPSSLQKQIAEITHGKPIPEFPKTEVTPHRAKSRGEEEELLDVFQTGQELSKLVLGFKVELMVVPVPKFSITAGVINDKKKLITINLWEGATRKDALVILAHEYGHIKPGTTEIERGLDEEGAWRRGFEYAREWGVADVYIKYASELTDFYAGRWPGIVRGIRRWLGTIRP